MAILHVGRRYIGTIPSSTELGEVLVSSSGVFTKWIEAEPVATISAEKVKKFYWQKIICRFGLPRYIVSDNGSQFTSEAVIKFCEEKRDT
jgi:transposase InsO family protein